MVLVFVPAGEFEMGAPHEDTEAADSEKPRHAVFLDDYWIDRNEVTNEQFRRFVEVTGHNAGTLWQGEALYKVQHPVASVTWSDASAYCLWAGRHLPTEAQWEKAARGTDGRRYPWGDQEPAGNLLNFYDSNIDADWAVAGVDDGYERTAPVGSFPDGASPYGALDMAGNVWEWVADWWDAGYYVVSPRGNPTGPSSGSERVLRGGAWDVVRDQRSTMRAHRDPQRLQADYGFRCATTSSPSEFDGHGDEYPSP